jgi:GTPase Era involved in 16S rRNA processing
MNAFVGEKIINYYFKAQTTRHRILDCKREDFQMILSDTRNYKASIRNAEAS